MNSKNTVTIGISAYQCEDNITQLLESLIKQKEKIFSIDEIIVYCDGCTDDTATLVKKMRKGSKKKITLIDNNENHGYAYSVQKIIHKNDSDVLILLNDDIIIDSIDLIENLAKTLTKKKRTGFVCGDISALPATNFIGKCVMTSFEAFREIRNNFRNGNSCYTVDGKVMALKKEFADTLNLIDSRITGNVDIYVYFQALTKGYAYAFCKKALVHHRLPETVEDYRNQKNRSRKTSIMLKNHFGDIVTQEHKLPITLYCASVLKAFLRNPVESIFFKVVINGVYFPHKKKSFKKWEIATSTKRLN